MTNGILNNMKGKKVDNDFVSTFISESCAVGKTTTNEVVASALEQIKNIDQKIAEVEHLKKIRSKLLDVVIIFDRNHRVGPQIDQVLINFHRVKDKKIAKMICEKIFNYSEMSEIKKAFSADEEIYCLKQLLEFNILQKYEEKIKAGENFSAFKLFLKENYEVHR